MKKSSILLGGYLIKLAGHVKDTNEADTALYGISSLNPEPNLLTGKLDTCSKTPCP